MQLPKISIITPSFNQGSFIEETIRSVLDQGYPDLEYLVMDGGSTDCTLDILRRYEDRLTWVSEPDRGQSHAINKGMARATGDVVAFLNSDDVYEPGALMKAGRFFADHPNAYWLSGRCRVVDQHGKEIRKLVTVYKNVWLWTRSFTVLQVLDYVSQPATFWRREAVETTGLFDESLRYAMDYDYSLRLGQKFRLWTLPVYLASYRIHPTSKAGSSVHAQFDVDLEIARKHVDSFLLIGMHKVHNLIITTMYHQWQPSDEI